jgi:hypothetical protein
MNRASGVQATTGRTRADQPGPGWRRAGAAALVLAAAALLACGESGKEKFGPTAFSAVSGERGVIPGRTVIVSVLDEDAQPVEGAQVSALSDPSDPASVIAATALPEGGHRLDGLAEGSVPILVEIAGRRHRIQHPSSNPRATLVVPVGGSLEVAWRVPPRATLPTGSLVLTVSARTEPDVRLEVTLGAQDAGTVAIPYLGPGEYLASLELWRLDRPSGRPAGILPMTDPRSFEIQEDQLTRIAVGMPPGGAAPVPPAEPGKL